MESFRAQGSLAAAIIGGVAGGTAALLAYNMYNRIVPTDPIGDMHEAQRHCCPNV